jgi:hypothetical protein
VFPFQFSWSLVARVVTTPLCIARKTNRAFEIIVRAPLPPPYRKKRKQFVAPWQGINMGLGGPLVITGMLSALSLSLSLNNGCMDGAVWEGDASHLPPTQTHPPTNFILHLKTLKLTFLQYILFPPYNRDLSLGLIQWDDTQTKQKTKTSLLEDMGQHPSILLTPLTRFPIGYYLRPRLQQ